MPIDPGTVHLVALLGTLLVEGAGITAWARLWRLRPDRALAAALLVNLVTHTLFWYAQPHFARFGPAGLYGAEIVVVLVEALFYRQRLALTGTTAWLLSFTLNLASFGAGILLWHTWF
jgi:hypothetical protein